MLTGGWPEFMKYPRPVIEPSDGSCIAALSLPRRYDWVRLLDVEASNSVSQLRADLSEHGLSLPTSTPDLLVVTLPRSDELEAHFSTPLECLNLPSQGKLNRSFELLEGSIAAGGFLLGVVFKKSLRSDRLYQPLYEANVMQLLLEGHLGESRADFEVHTLDSVGTRAALSRGDCVVQPTGRC